MLVYKNNSISVKTFYGVTFRPGDIKEVPGYINSNKFIRMKSVPKELPERAEVVEPKKSVKRGRPKKNTKGAEKVTKQAEVDSKPKESQSNKGGND